MSHSVARALVSDCVARALVTHSCREGPSVTFFREWHVRFFGAGCSVLVDAVFVV